VAATSLSSWSQADVLGELVAERYGLSEVTLEPISPYTFEDRGIYRVRGRDGSAFVLRAFTGDVMSSLRRQVAVLDLLQQRRLSAPVIQRAGDGSAIAHWQGWTALLVTYVEGDVASFSPEDVETLAGYLGRLHNLPRDVAQSEPISIGLTPTHPGLAADQALANLSRALPQVPDWLKQFCQDSIASIGAVEGAHRSGLLPETIIHGDCWPANAVRQPDGQIVLIDWDRAGIGLAFLDLCYLLLTCHLGKPQLPAMEPDEALITAVVRGYCRERRPSAAELNLLESGLLYDIALRAGYDIHFDASAESLIENVWLQKLLARYGVCPRIATVARELFRADGELR